MIPRIKTLTPLDDYKFEGTYIVKGDTLVRTHYYRTLPNGEQREGNDEYELNLKEKPHTLTYYAYSQDGMLLELLVFVKQ